MNIFKKIFCGTQGKGENLGNLLDSENGKPSVVILSASCCNPMAIPGDKKFKNNVKEAFKKIEIDSVVHMISVTEAQASMNSIPDQYKGLASKLMSLFQTQGIKAFPVLIVNGNIVFYGGIPDTEQITEKLRSLSIA